MGGNVNNAILDEATFLQAIGYDIILVDSNKNPGIVKDWPTHVWDAAEFESWLARRDDLSLALRLGEYIDVEIDCENADERISLENEVQGRAGVTVSWDSKRGRHWLFSLSPEQRQILLDRNSPSVIKYEGIEFRLGFKPAQSLIPTPGNDYRKWNCEPQSNIVAQMPNSIWSLLYAATAKKIERERSEPKPDDAPQRPGDVFNESVEWRDILANAGWRVFNESGNVIQWTRPGKASGLSATSGYCGTDNRPDCFYVFSSAAEIAPFECNKTYTKFEAWTLLNFDGDFKAAAVAAMKSGYSPDVDHSCSEFDDFPEPEIVVKQETHKSSISKAVLTDAPEPDSLVYDFVLGKYVQDLIPYTEAYPPAILFQLMEVAGVLAGRRTFFAHGDYKFRLNGGTIVIGESGISRKGTGLHYARLPFANHDNEQDINSIITETDQVSGEGFIQALANKPNHTMLIACEEFAGVLKSTKREGSSLSPVIRKALDAKPLGIDARKNKIDEMHDAFASIIGHCTLDEFIENISLDDIRNGFLNRFQFTMSRQNSKIAFPESVPESVKTPVREAFSLLFTPKEFGDETIITFAPNARPIWEEFYLGTGKEQSSLRDTLGARTPSQVLRNAARIALLEKSTQVDARRLRIALAMQQYGADCIDYIFSDYINADEDEIIQFLLSDKNGKTWHDINEWVARWKKHKRQTKRLITRLLDKRLITNRAVKTTEGAGRPANRLVYVGAAIK